MSGHYGRETASKTKRHPPVASPDMDLAPAAALLGGDELLGRSVTTQLDAHDLVLQGIPAAALDHLLETLAFLPRDSLLDGAVGMGLRTFQRRRDASGRTLNREQGSRTWAFAKVLAKAIEVFGSRDEAERWLDREAIGLDQRRPIDLLSTAAGADVVETFLERLDYGVYT